MELYLLSELQSSMVEVKAANTQVADEQCSKHTDSRVDRMRHGKHASDNQRTKLEAKSVQLKNPSTILQPRNVLSSPRWNPFQGRTVR